MDLDRQLANEAKAIVALAFRNGPLEDLHAGKRCLNCHGDPTYSHITQEEMAQVIKSAVHHVYRLLLLKKRDCQEFERQINFGNAYTKSWDDPVLEGGSTQETSR